MPKKNISSVPNRLFKNTLHGHIILIVSETCFKEAMKQIWKATIVINTHTYIGLRSYDIMLFLM